jgi:hypothetical protein
MAATPVAVPLRDASPAAAIAAVGAAGIATTAISTRRPSLDDVYLRLTGEGLPAAA